MFSKLTSNFFKIQYCYGHCISTEKQILLEMYKAFLTHFQTCHEFLDNLIEIEKKKEKVSPVIISYVQFSLKNNQPFIQFYSGSVLVVYKCSLMIYWDNWNIESFRWAAVFNWPRAGAHLLKKLVLNTWSRVATPVQSYISVSTCSFSCIEYVRTLGVRGRSENVVINA